MPADYFFRLMFRRHYLLITCLFFRRRFFDRYTLARHDASSSLRLIFFDIVIEALTPCFMLPLLTRHRHIISMFVCCHHYYLPAMSAIFIPDIFFHYWFRCFDILPMFWLAADFCWRCAMICLCRAACYAQDAFKMPRHILCCSLCWYALCHMLSEHVYEECAFERCFDAMICPFMVFRYAILLRLDAPLMRRDYAAASPARWPFFTLVARRAAARWYWCRDTRSMSLMPLARSDMMFAFAADIRAVIIDAYFFSIILAPRHYAWCCCPRWYVRCWCDILRAAMSSGAPMRNASQLAHKDMIIDALSCPRSFRTMPAYVYYRWECEEWAPRVRATSLMIIWCCSFTLMMPIFRECLLVACLIIVFYASCYCYCFRCRCCCCLFFSRACCLIIVFLAASRSYWLPLIIFSRHLHMLACFILPLFAAVFCCRAPMFIRRIFIMRRYYASRSAAIYCWRADAIFTFQCLF